MVSGSGKQVATVRASSLLQVPLFYDIVAPTHILWLLSQSSATALVRVARENGQVTFEVQDHGKGMTRTDSPATTSQDSPATPGIGLRGMTERLREVGGTLEINSTEQGTVVRAIVPVTARADAAGMS